MLIRYRHVEYTSPNLIYIVRVRTSNLLLQIFDSLRISQTILPFLFVPGSNPEPFLYAQSSLFYELQLLCNWQNLMIQCCCQESTINSSEKDSLSPVYHNAYFAVEIFFFHSCKLWMTSLCLKISQPKPPNVPGSSSNKRRRKRKRGPLRNLR